MEYRLNKQTLTELLGQWNAFLRRKIHLIACGGTALTLMDIKPSTKDVDFIVPVEPEYRYLIKTLKDLGYKQQTGSGWHKSGNLFVFDLFMGQRIHTTDLLESPLEKGNHTLFKEFSHLYIGILNPYDLIASKLFRGTVVDFEDCLMLMKSRKESIDLTRVEQHVKELANYDISENRIIVNLEYFLNQARKELPYG
ncbi:MAG: hypothetical protein OQK64_08475 [Ignavibacteriaceae bacterium]|jgi:Nucleotidyltransferase of unknown function (DUF6036)|nr:hypothetical protein [Ignavibacteriaceae bacterium]